MRKEERAKNEERKVRKRKEERDKVEERGN